MTKAKKSKYLTTKETINGFDKRQLQREKKIDSIISKRQLLDEKLAQAQKSGNIAAANRLEAQIKKCAWEIAVVDLNEAQDRLALAQAELRSLERGLKSRFLSFTGKGDLEKAAFEKDRQVVNAMRQVAQAKAMCWELVPRKTPKARPAKNQKATTARAK